MTTNNGQTQAEPPIKEQVREVIGDVLEDASYLLVGAARSLCGIAALFMVVSVAFGRGSRQR